MADLNPSHYYIVQISEYEAMEAEIERLRAAGDGLATHYESLYFHSGDLLEAWKEARNG